MTSDEEKNEIYKVVSGDTLSGIAIKTNVPLDKLIEMNESLEDENSMIRPDQELIVTVEEPMLAVLRQEEMYYEEDYDADVIYIDNDDWYTTETVVHQQPSAGHRKVVAVVAFENNKKVSEEIIKEEITYVAVPKVVERGTKIPPTYIKPISGGRLTSNFGRRNRPTPQEAQAPIIKELTGQHRQEPQFMLPVVVPLQEPAGEAATDIVYISIIRMADRPGTDT